MRARHCLNSVCHNQLRKWPFLLSEHKKVHFLNGHQIILCLETGMQHAKTELLHWESESYYRSKEDFTAPQFTVEHHLSLIDGRGRHHMINEIWFCVLFLNKSEGLAEIRTNKAPTMAYSDICRLSREFKTVPGVSHVTCQVSHVTKPLLVQMR